MPAGSVPHHTALPNLLPRAAMPKDPTEILKIPKPKGLLSSTSLKLQMVLSNSVIVSWPPPGSRGRAIHSLAASVVEALAVTSMGFRAEMGLDGGTCGFGVQGRCELEAGCLNPIPSKGRVELLALGLGLRVMESRLWGSPYL